MMLWKRPLLALAIVSTILGTVWAYDRFQATLRTPVVVASERASKAVYQLEVTTTFAASPDAFALDDSHSLLVNFRGKPLLKETQPIEAGRPLRINEIPGVVEGRNEFYLEVFPDDPGDAVEHAVRLRILSEGDVVAEKTLWSAAGEPVRGVMILDVPVQSHGVEH